MTRPFFRGREFHWIEGHDVFATMEEAEAQVRQKVEALFRAVDDVPELREVLQVILNDCPSRPRYLALELDISVREVDNRLKRLRRCASKLAKEDVPQSH